MFFAKVEFEETPPDKAFGTLTEAWESLFIHPVLAVGNNLRARCYPMLLAGEGKSYKEFVYFEFNFGEITYIEHPPRSLPSSLPVVAFMLPESLDISVWTTAHPLDTAPRRSGSRDLQYTVFPDARNHPVRLIIASLLCRKLDRGSYFWLPSVDEVFAVPSGALNHPDKREILEDDAMRLWSQKNDIDWYTACNDAPYRALVSRWMQNMLETFQGKDFLSSGDVLQVQPSAFDHQLKPLFGKEPLPSETSAYIQEIRRNTDDHAFRTKLSQMEALKSESSKK
ncbi:hypothetical protein FS837_003268 [Tulasnella sp. UAMH 9824]|nr:hypothetical protein FS837_003268 [Tulasnella sp. UAMH 9824]